MKKPFTVSVKVEAYSQAEAQAKVDLLLQMGAFLKDFNLNKLVGSIANHFLISKVTEIAEKQKPDATTMNSRCVKKRKYTEFQHLK